MATNAINVGLDDSKIDIVVRIELPRSLLTYFQERGRVARVEGSSGTSVLFASVESYVNIIRQILGNKSREEEEPTIEQLQIIGAGSAITPLSARAQRRIQEREAADDVPAANSPKKTKYALSKSMKIQLRRRQLRDLEDVLRYFFLHKGCQHARSSFYLSQGILDGKDAVDASREAECDNCPICIGEWQKMHLPVYKPHIIRLFESSTGRKLFPVALDFKTSPSTFLSTRPYWKEWIFDRPSKAILVRHVDALLLSLLAAGILCIEKSKTSDIVLDITWSDSSTPKYRDASIWDGVNLHDEERPRLRSVILNE
jgi:hypothetical protein